MMISTLAASAIWICISMVDNDTHQAESGLVGTVYGHMAVTTDFKSAYDSAQLMCELEHPRTECDTYCNEYDPK